MRRPRHSCEILMPIHLTTTNQAPHVGIKHGGPLYITQEPEINILFIDNYSSWELVGYLLIS